MPFKKQFSPIWHNIWVWNCLLPSCYHLLVQVRHARSHFFPFGTNDWAKPKPKCQKYALFFWKSRVILSRKSVFNHSFWYQNGKKRLLVCLICTNKWHQQGNSEFHTLILDQMAGNVWKLLLKRKNGQFYSIKWQKNGFSQKGPAKLN